MARGDTMMPPPRPDVSQVQDALDTLHEISDLLSTGLDKETLGILMGLIDQGINPEALACAVKELQAKDSDDVKDDKSFHH